VSRLAASGGLPESGNPGLSVLLLFIIFIIWRWLSLYQLGGRAAPLAPPCGKESPASPAKGPDTLFASAHTPVGILTPWQNWKRERG
jgi:hypothetical protein